MSTNLSERIRKRLLRNASTLLGMENAEVSTLDPVVNMLFGALSKELEKVYNEQTASKSRVLSRLSKVLLPQVVSGPVPAHGVMHVRPYEAVYHLPQSAQFFFKRKKKALESSFRDDFQEVYFAPLVDIPIYNATIDLHVIGSGLYKVQDVYLKERMAEAKKVDKNRQHIYWLGIDCNGLLTTEDSTLKVPLYFNWPSSPDKNLYLDALSLVRAFAGDRELPCNQGHPLLDHGSAHSSPFSENTGNSFVDSARAFYRRHYLTLSIDLEVVRSSVGMIPSSLKQMWSEDVIGLLGQNLLWLRFEFPPFVTADVLSDSICSLNAVPVANLRLNEFNFRIQQDFNVVPIETRDEHFYRIISVKSIDGTAYISSSAMHHGQPNNGEYVIREGGVERFDERNADQMLAYLIDMLKEESASFALLGPDAIQADLQALRRQITALGQKVKLDTRVLRQMQFLVAQPKTTVDTVFVEFWSTLGISGNDVRLGSELQPSSGADVRSQELVMLSHTSGGKDALGEGDSLRQFKSVLTNRDRLVSVEDIQSFCISELPVELEDLPEINLTYGLSRNSRQGFCKKLQVRLYLPEESALSHEAWLAIAAHLQAKIEIRTPMLYEVEVLLGRPSESKMSNPAKSL
jgi:hypothetical protein